TWASAAAPARITSGPWPRRWAGRSRPASTPRRWSCTRCSGPTSQPGTPPSCTAGRREGPPGAVVRLAPLGVPGVDGGRDAAGGDVIDVAGDAHLRRERGRAEQALDVGLDRDVRVGHGGGLQRG